MSDLLQVGTVVPNLGVCTEIKDIGHEQYVMAYTFDSGKVRYMKRARLVNDRLVHDEVYNID